MKHCVILPSQYSTQYSLSLFFPEMLCEKVQELQLHASPVTHPIDSICICNMYMLEVKKVFIYIYTAMPLVLSWKTQV